MIRVAVISSFVVLAIVALGVMAFLSAGCSLHRPVPRPDSSLNGSQHQPDVPASPAQLSRSDSAASEVTRVGGDLQISVERVNGEFRTIGGRITTPLPEGYPAPTPPGAIELKRYPVVRRAEISGTMSPDWGMNFAFFPLFNHIKRREIAMTSPVEMNYEGLGGAGELKPSAWTMSFLYRRADQGPAGEDPKDERILIEDIPPMTVVAIGMRGPYKLTCVNKGIAAIRDWLAKQNEWEQAGDPRALFYNGPEARSRDKWSEVQIPLHSRVAAIPM